MRYLLVRARQIAALRVALTKTAADSGIWAEAGHLTPDSYLREELGIENGVARADVKTAHALESLPALAQAFRCGQVEPAALDKVIKVGTANPHRQAALPDYEAALTQVACTQSMTVLGRVLAAWADNIDPLTTEYDEEQAYKRRNFHLNPLGDGWDVKGFLTHEQGAYLAAGLNATLAAAHNHAPAPGGGGDSGLGEAGGRDPLAFLGVNAQKRADALTDLAKMAAASGRLPECGVNKPTIILTVPIHRLDNDPGLGDTTGPTTGAGAEAGEARYHFPEQRLPFVDDCAELSVSNGPGAATVSTTTAQRIACDGDLTRILTTTGGIPLDVGRTTRIISHALRKALHLRDKGCIHPRCDRPPSWTEGRHVIPWSQGGPTALSNLALLCSKHHHDLHAHGHTITFTTDKHGGTSRPTLELNPPKIKTAHHRRH